MPVPFRATFQTKFFLSAVSAALIALVVAGAIFATTMRRQIVFDPAGFLDAAALADAGFVHAVVGRPA